ncbi:hypothetical protein H4R20_003687 [Coemansia guatemalensis]|uniref:TPR-like protein n=1 Tax=Coemansia guatemalensis TaxID=2761395 RepID=A0A9W8LTH2_9FUNG|nr:hypothetical protein H4R20_003687 [Coemansia guatemalensis]
MLGSRHQSVLKEIDAARCVGHWSTVRSLAAKVSKHGSPGQVFSTTVVSEAELEEHLLELEWDPQSHWGDECSINFAGDDTQVTVHYPMSIPSSRFLEGVERRLLKVAKHSMTEEEEYQFKVVLAKVYFYSSKFDPCQGTIGELATSIADESTLSPAYSKQLYMAQMTMRGIVLEMEGKRAAAHALYEKAVVALKEKVSSQAAIVVPRGSEPGAKAGSQEELVNWAEEALYRRAMMSLALGDNASGTRELSSYLRTMDSVTPTSFRAFRRLRANRLYMHMLRQAVKAAAPDSSATAETRGEVMAAHRRQIALLKTWYAFPKANETHEEVLHEADSAVRDWDLVRAYARVDLLRLLELLYEAVHLTYNSPQVLRHLVHTLIRVGDYHEASLALSTYRMLVERQLERVKKAIAGGSEASVVFGADTESIDSILRTAAVGARLHLVHLGSAHECLSVIHFARDVTDSMEACDPEHRVAPAAALHIQAQLALWKGAAHGRLAQRSRDPDNRAEHHGAALQLLQQAVEQSPGLYDAHYHLALEQALGARNVSAATAAAKRAVELDASRLEAWHLLALLSTARKDYAQAQKICTVAMKQSDWWETYNRIRQGPADAGVPAQPGSVETGMLFFDLAMTHMAIEAQRRGFDVFLEAQPQLFALYGCVYGPVVGAADGPDDASAAMDSARISVDALPADGTMTPSLASGRRSMARSLARTVFSKHTRHASHGGSAREASSGARPALPVQAASADAPEPPSPLASYTQGRSAVPKLPDSPKRQRSMPHLRRASGDSSATSPEVPTEAYFDSLSQLVGRAGAGAGSGGRSHVVAAMGASNSVYYTPVATRLTHQRREAKRALCSLWLATAAAFVALQRLDEAADAISEALAACPESPAALAMRGHLHIAEHRLLPALNEFHAAVSLEPSCIRASVGLARVEYLLGRRDVALGLLKNLTRAHGWSDPEAWFWLARIERELALEHPAAENPTPDADHACQAAPSMAMMRRALEYAVYALDLEDSQPVRAFSVLRP